MLIRSVRSFVNRQGIYIMSNCVFIRVLSVLLLIVTSPSMAASWKDPVSLADWSVLAKPSVIERNFGKSAIAKFVDNIRGVYDENLDTAEIPAKPEQIGEFKWIDINNDGVYELLVTFAETRAIYSGPMIFKSEAGNKSLLQIIPGNSSLLSFDKSLLDLNNDGTIEILAASAIAKVFSGTAQPNAMWIDVYQLVAGKYVLSSKTYASYYIDKQLPEVEARISKLTARGLSSTDHELAVQLMLRDKILRFTGKDSRAGIDIARSWASSRDQDLRCLSADVFIDAGVVVYSADIQLLVSDPNPYVSGYAKARLKAARISN